MNNFTNKRHLTNKSLLAIAISLAINVPVYAQESPTTASQDPSVENNDSEQAPKKRESLLMETIVVTAQKRTESIQNVGIAITAFNGDQLDRLGVENSTEIAKFTPGVSLSGSFAGQQQQFSIRGVTQNDFNDHVESPNAIYIDEAYVAMQQGQIFSTFDLERVEVLKGPQGTLFGRNATGGLVSFITRKPTDDFEGYVDLTVGSYQQRKVEGAISGPLTDDISYRISGFSNVHDGYLNNQFPEETYVPTEFEGNLSNGPALPNSGADLGGDDSWAVRAQLLFDISDESELLISAFSTRSTQSTGPYQSAPVIAEVDELGRTINTFRVSADETREFIHPTNPNFDNGFDNDFDGVRPVPGGDFYGYIDPDGNDFNTSSDFSFDDSNTYETYGTTVNYSHEFDDITFTSITDFKHHEKFTVLDLEAAPQSQFTWFGQADIDSFTQELRLTGGDDDQHWVTGLYFLDIDALSITGLSALANGTVLPDFGFTDFDEPRIADLGTRSYSVFGQIENQLSDNVKLITGLRATKEEKDYFFDVRYAGNNTDPLAWDLDALNAASSRATGAFTDDTSQTLVTGKIQLDWQISDDLLAYSGYNRGVKAGSFNSSGAALADEDVPYEDEILHAFEVGFKSVIWDGIARFNAAAYYYDYKDYQASRWDGLGNVITNNDSTIKGLEFELTTSPIEGLDLLLNLGLIDAEVEDLDLVGDGSVLVDVEPTFSPDTTLSGLARYTVYDFAGGDLSFQASASYQSSIYSNLSNFDSTHFDSWTVVDALVSWTSTDETWAIDLFVKNLLDERYNTIGFDLAGVCGCNEEAQGKPRWVGASVRYNFF
jgi:iron complex outermembrane receptor protein